MADVAGAAGVSRALVSTVFRGVPGASAATRERVLKAASDLGYQMDNRARRLRRSRSQLVGVMFRVQDAFHADLVEALYAAAQGSGYELVLSATMPGHSEFAAVESLLSDRCEALILIGPQCATSDLEAWAARVPVVVATRDVHVVGVDVVRTGDTDVAGQAIDYLVGLGHQDIAHLDGGTFRGARSRVASYKASMRRHGLDSYIRIFPGGGTEDDGMRAARAVLDTGNRPTSVMAFNDRSAIGLVFGLRDSVRVPQDVSVIGFDGIRMGALPYINLTTICQDVPGTADRVMQRVVTRLDEGDSTTTTTLVAPFLEVRETACPPLP